MIINYRIFLTTLSLCFTLFISSSTESLGQVRADVIFPDPLPEPIKQAPVSPNDLIRLATKAPTTDDGSSEKYLREKEEWVKENPDAYNRIVGTEPNSSPQSED